MEDKPKKVARPKPPCLLEESLLELGPGNKLISNGEYLLRMNFLLQAQQLLANESNDFSAFERHLLAEVKNISKR